MNKVQDNSPFFNWVPRPIGILILLTMFIPPTFSGGAYLSNLSEMVGGLGVTSEDIQLASFFTSIGMCLFPPFMIRFLQTRSIKRTYIICFSLLFFLNWICAETESMPVLFFTCLCIGFIRAVAMFNCTFTIAPYLTGMNTLEMFTTTQVFTPDEQYATERKRTFLMPVLYTFILIIAQLSNTFSAWFAYNYTWQDSYYGVMLMLVIAIVIAATTMKNDKNYKHTKFDYSLIPDMLTLCVALCCMTYILVFGKTLDWFNDISIRWSLAGLLLSCGIMMILNIKTRKSYYLPMEVFKFRNIFISVMLFIAFMIFNSASNFISTNAKMSTPINNLHSAELSNWAIVGCIAGFIVSILMILRKVKFKIIFITGFAFMASANMYMYFNYQSIGLYDNMFLPMVLNFTGLLILYSVVPAFSMKSLPTKYLVTAVFLMILTRNAIGPTIGTSIYSNWLNERQQHYIILLSDDLDSRNIIASDSFSRTESIGKIQGKNALESKQTASASLKQQTAIQATFLAMKDITGKTIWIIAGIMIIVWFIPYHRNETI